MSRNLIAGLAAVVIGGVYLWMAFGLRASALADAVGPAGLPRILGMIMVGFGLVLCAQALLAGSRSAAPAVPAVPAGGDVGPAEGEPDEAGGFGLSGVARAGGLLAIGIGYLLIIRTVGYIVAVGALIIVAALYGGARLSWRVFAIGAAGAAVYWILFVEILRIPLPAGMLAQFL